MYQSQMLRHTCIQMDEIIFPLHMPMALIGRRPCEKCTMPARMVRHLSLRVDAPKARQKGTRHRDGRVVIGDVAERGTHTRPASHRRYSNRSTRKKKGGMRLARVSHNILHRDNGRNPRSSNNKINNNNNNNHNHHHHHSNYNNYNKSINNTSSSDFSDEGPPIERRMDDSQSSQSSDSQSMGLQIPTGYLLGPSPKSSSPLSPGSPSREDGGSMQRLLMLAKHPNATEEQVADQIARQQIQQQQLVERQRNRTNAKNAYPVDADTGEAWEKRQRNARKGAGSPTSPIMRNGAAGNWTDHENQMPSQGQERASEPAPRFSFFRNLFSPSPPADAPSVCNASKEPSLTPSYSTDKTPKISNVDPKLRDERIRRESGHKTPTERVHEGWTRLIKTRNGNIVLILLIVLLIAIIVTISAALASANRQKKAALETQPTPGTYIPRPGTEDFFPSPSPTTSYPTLRPTPRPSEKTPTSSPFASPVPPPSRGPTRPPTDQDTPRPTGTPTIRPTPSPTKAPTKSPTRQPTTVPTRSPTTPPTRSPAPSTSPTSEFFATEFSASDDPLPGTTTWQRFGHVVALSEDGTVLAVGSPNATVNGMREAGIVQVYQLIDDSWMPRGDALVGRNPSDQFGTSVALSQDGNVLAASEPRFRGDAGRWSGNVRVFVYGPLSQYDPIGGELEGEAASDHFGISVSLSGDGRRLAVGAPLHNSGVGRDQLVSSGQVRVFEFVNNNWSIIGEPLVGFSAYDWFGWKVDISIDGEMLAVGAPRNLEHGGYVSCYERSGRGWSQIGRTIRNSRDLIRYDDNFGHAVKLDGNRRVAIGAPGKNGDTGATVDAGLAAVYELDSNDEWVALGRAIIDPNASPGHLLGFDVDLRENVLVVGSPGKRQVDFYQYNPSTNDWDIHPTPLIGAPESNFGFSVRLTTKLVVGSPLTGGPNTGHVEIFTKS